MTSPGLGVVLALVVWGALAGIDLVSFPQALLSRPLVAGSVAGLLLGDVEAGLRVGVLLELFALDVLPVGASRYPDYGAGVVGAVVLATADAGMHRLGVATLYALGFATLGGWSLLGIRRLNGRLIQRYSAGLASGDAGAIEAVQWRGMAADGIRSLLLSALSVPFALWLRTLVPTTQGFVMVSAVAIGAGVAAAAGGAIRGAGRGARLRWLAVGTGVGLVAAAIR